MVLPLYVNEEYLNYNIQQFVNWVPSVHPHCAIFGASGSGKTYALRLLLGRIGLHVPDAEVIVCDYKGDDDFSFLNGLANFYRFSDCLHGLENIVSLLKERQQNCNDKHFVAFVFDEWASFISSLDKKTADSARQSLALLLQLGRSFHIHVILSQQRMDSSYFASARDNFSVILGMGKLSKEAVEMMFSEFKEQINRTKPRGYGSLVMGSDFYNVVVPKVRDPVRLEECIYRVVARNP